MARNFDDDEPSSGPTATGIVAMILPFATAIAALAVGAVLGVAIGLVLKPSSVVEKSVPRELTAAELAAACAPQLETKVTELEQAQNKVQFLEKEVTDRDARVRELEQTIEQRKGSGGASKELLQARRDLEDARAQLEIARAEKEALVVELTATKTQLAKTEQALVEQVEKTVEAKEDALTNKFYRYVNDSQLEICERGSRKKMGNCRENVQGSLTSNARRDKFAHCVRSGQATPTVKELEKDQKLPDFAEMINEDERTTKGYYVLFCDPTLPEREELDLDEQHLPPGNAN